MTKDEAIKILQTEMECVQRPDCDRLACAYCDLAMRAEDVLTAYQMAITALQTDGDCISRQKALDDIETVDPSILLDVNWVKNWVKTLPSAQPEPCEDAISRADAIRVASGYCHPANVAKELAKLPSAQPYTDEEMQKIQELEQAEIQKAFLLGREDALSEIIRCKDCKFYTPLNRETKTGICGLLLHQNFGDDWHCAGAERRTDEGN